MPLKGAFILLLIVAAVTADFECREEGIFADPDDCRSFYQCLSDPNAESGFDPIKDTCTIDLLFDDIVMVCNYPEFVDCGDRPIIDGPTSPTTSSVATTVPTTVTMTVTTTATTTTVTSDQTTTSQVITTTR